MLAIEKAKNSRGEARAARWREMLPPADEEWQTLTLRKTDERTRLVDVDGASSEFQQISLRKTATTQPVADRSAPKAFSSPRPPSGATSSVPMEPTAPREAGPEAAAFSRFLDATDIVSMQQALNECCEASGSKIGCINQQFHFNSNSITWWSFMEIAKLWKIRLNSHSHP